MPKFKVIVISIFAASIVFGIGFFAVSKGKNAGQMSNIVIWGTIPTEIFNSALENSSLKQNELISVAYIKKDKSDFNAEFVEALAEGKGPDIVILRDDFMYKNRNKILTIPYKNYSERTFKDTFVQGGEIFLDSNGISALPFMIDPLVMYWNRDLFAGSQVVNPPKYWDDSYSLIEKISKRDSSANITRSALSLGEWRNITNAKEILSVLLLQAGTPIITKTDKSASSVLSSQLNLPVIPGQAAVSFYTQFSNPTSPTYTWNRSLPSSLNFFLSGDLAVYFGFASEILSIQQKNSNLNFDVASIPQIRDSEKKITFAHIYGLAIVKQTKQLGGAFAVIKGLTEPASIKALEDATNLPPVRKDLLVSRPTDAFRSVFYDSALISKTWLDPEPDKSSLIFRDMIESVTSGKSRVGDALSNADRELSVLLK